MAAYVSRYNSLLDWSTWALVGVIETVCLFPLFLDDDREMQLVIIGVAFIFLVFMLIMFKGIYFELEGNKPVVYEFFRPSVLPIDKIESITPIKTILACSATSLVHRLAIKFTDRSVLKSSMPLIISPEKQDEFIAQLLEINPKIVTDNKSE